MNIKEYLMQVFAEEKEQFSQYSQLCARYQSNQDPIIVAKHKAKIQLLQQIMKDLQSL